jgi:RNA polymerase sigma factor (sigma-70 family)
MTCKNTSTSTYNEKDAFTRLALARATGDNKTFTSIRDEIMLANGGLVRVLAQRACRYYAHLGLSTTCYDYTKEAAFSVEDFVQYGYILLHKAIINYSLAAGAKFSTYATTVVGRGLNQVFNSRALRQYVPHGFVSLDADVDDEKGQASLRNMLPDENALRAFEEFALKDIGRILSKALSTLSKRERDIVRMSQGFGCEKRKLVDIAKMLGITPQRVTQILKEAFRKLRMHPALMELRRAG